MRSSTSLSAPPFVLMLLSCTSSTVPLSGEMGSEDLMIQVVGTNCDRQDVCGA